MSQDLRTCVNHPSRETRVSCSSCGNPICPSCMRETPVGMKCPSCARLPRRAVRMGKPRHFAAAAAAGLGAATVLGAAMVLLRLGFVGFIFPLLSGFLIGEAVLRAASRQGTRPFVVIAVVTTVVGLVVGGMLVGVPARVALFPGRLLGLVIAAAVAGFRVAR